MARRFVNPSLADVTQDIAGVIPLDIITKWQDNKSKDLHKQILNSYKKTGTVVSTDSSGLSKLSQSLPLIEVMKIVSHPKDVVYKHGSSIGGEAVGIWAADNTQMFYPEEISSVQILEKMTLVQQELNDFKIKIGMAIHFGEFFEIGGGLYGEAADLVEELAENEAEGGEIKLTKEFKDKLRLGSSETKPVKASSSIYPIPFSKEFHQDITSENYNLQNIEKKYTQTKTVVLLKIIHKDREFLLDELTDWILANSIVTQIAELYKIQKIKSNGNLGIFVSDDNQVAIEFAQDLKDNLSEIFELSIGISRGDVLLFDLGNEVWEIAGEPVNISSKIAEDSGEKNAIMIESSVNHAIKKAKPFKFNISSVEISGVRI